MAAIRRLAAIMFTDMVGFTASVQTDEAGALKLLQDQEKLIRSLLKTHAGKEIKSTGDGFLVEFDSALQAVECAIVIQERLQERNLRPVGQPIRLRIGVHLGDVEEREGDIFGDSVNLAARIEPCADPGGICISESVFEQVRNKVANGFEKLEPQVLKNVRFPPEIYRIVLPWSGPETHRTRSEPLGLAVLPFTNISPDPTDEYFADGLTEELITVLAQMRGLRVIARTSVMQYKSTSKSVSQVAVELGVSSILEGSVRKVGNRVRITAQLIDAASQGHVWANTYDRELDDVFAVQARIARQVAEALRVELRPAEELRLVARPSVRSDSYLAYLKGRTLMHSAEPGSLAKAKAEFERSVSLDPRNGAACSGLADVTRLIGWGPPTLPREKWEAASRRWTTRALALDPNLAEAHTSRALALWDDYDYAGAHRELSLALSLNPSYSSAHLWFAGLLFDEGRIQDALEELLLAEAADPLWTGALNWLALTFIVLGKFDEALPRIQKLGEIAPATWAYHTVLARYYAARSERERSLEEIRKIEKLVSDTDEKERWRAMYYMCAGEKEKCRALLRQEAAKPKHFRSDWGFAWMYARLGDLDESFRWLDKAWESHHLPLSEFQLDPELELFRNDPRFHALLKRLNIG